MALENFMALVGDDLKRNSVRFDFNPVSAHMSRHWDVVITRLGRRFGAFLFLLFGVIGPSNFLGDPGPNPLPIGLGGRFMKVASSMESNKRAGGKTRTEGSVSDSGKNELLFHSF